MRGNSPTVLRYVRALCGNGALGGLSDGQLLERFIASDCGSDRSDAELAFATLMERHGPMVWRVCRSLVCGPQDAEDAFQATFLVLVQKAGTLRVRQSLGPWLYGVSYRIGLSTRSAIAKRRAVERRVAERTAGSWDRGTRTGDGEATDGAALVHKAITGLPRRFRDAVVLCDIEGLTYLEAAMQLSVPLGTLQSRLARARRRLRARLVQLDVPEPAASDNPISTADGLRSVGPPIVLAHRTCHCCLQLVLEPSRFTQIVSTPIQELIRKGSRSVFLSKLSGAAFIVTTAMIVGGVFVLDNRSSAQPRPDADRPGPMKTAKSRERPSRAVKSLVFPPPAELKATAGRGKVLLYELDEHGNRISEPPVRRVEKWKETARELRWAVVTGVVDNRSIQEVFSWLQKSFASVSEQTTPVAPKILYRRVELERQQLVHSKNGRDWSDWLPVEIESNFEILDNLPEEDQERTSPNVRLMGLVDPLPLLVEGSWAGVDADRFLPPSTAKKQSGSGDRVTSPKVGEPPALMIRSFDFTVEPGQSYRYRARLLFLAPRVGELAGPWSQTTEQVTINAD